jgi:hypothetical protein
MVFTSISDQKIMVRNYEINPGKEINETDAKNKSFQMSDIGPNFDLNLKRTNIALAEVFKEACKQPKLLKAATKLRKKNMFTDEFG